MYIFSEQTSIDPYAEINADISYFNKDTKQSSATRQNAEKLIHSEAALTNI